MLVTAISTRLRSDYSIQFVAIQFYSDYSIQFLSLRLRPSTLPTTPVLARPPQLGTLPTTRVCSSRHLSDHSDPSESYRFRLLNSAHVLRSRLLVSCLFWSDYPTHGRYPIAALLTSLPHPRLLRYETDNPAQNIPSRYAPDKSRLARPWQVCSVPTTQSRSGPTVSRHCRLLTPSPIHFLSVRSRLHISSRSCATPAPTSPFLTGQSLSTIRKRVTSAPTSHCHPESSPTSHRHPIRLCPVIAAPLASDISGASSSAHAFAYTTAPLDCSILGMSVLLLTALF